MKSVIPQLRRGDDIQAEVVECLTSQILICSFAGDLLRVKNSSGVRVDPGHKIYLTVVSTKPLEFALVKRSAGLSRHI